MARANCPSLSSIPGAGQAGVAQQQWSDINDAIARLRPTPIKGVTGIVTAHVSVLSAGINLDADYIIGEASTRTTRGAR